MYVSNPALLPWRNTLLYTTECPINEFFSFLLHFIAGKSEFGVLNNNCMVFVKLKIFLHAQISCLISLDNFNETRSLKLQITL